MNILKYYCHDTSFFSDRSVFFAFSRTLPHSPADVMTSLAKLSWLLATSRLKMRLEYTAE